MTTVNVSLPDKLKKEAEALVESGYYASFSDIVRSALRDLVSSSKYDLMLKEAKDEYRKGEGDVLKSDKDIKTYVKKVFSS